MAKTELQKDFSHDLADNLGQLDARLRNLERAEGRQVTALKVTLWNKIGLRGPPWVKHVYDALEPDRSFFQKLLKPPEKFLEGRVRAVFGQLKAQGLNPQLTRWDEITAGMHGTETRAYGFRIAITP